MKKNKDCKPAGNVSFLLLLAAIALLQPACGPCYLTEEEKDITNGLWAYTDTLNFRFTVSDTSEIYGIYLDFEYADTFSSQNIYVNLHTVFPDGKRLSKQKSFDFFDDQGKPLGKCSGGKCRLRAVLQERTIFNQPGEYVIGLEQYTRSNPLPGIYSVGLAIPGSER